MAGKLSLADEMNRREARAREAAPLRTEQERSPRDWSHRGAEESESADAVPVDTQAFGYYRGVRERCSHVEFQRLQGSWPAGGYAWLPHPEWFPSGDGQGRGQAIVLDYATGMKVTIRGRNLREMYERLLRHQVYRITEMGEDTDTSLAEDATAIYTIEVVREPGHLG